LHEVIGKRIDRFLSEPLEQFLTGYIASAGSQSSQGWIPEGMRAVRKNGDPFPIEATVSRTDVSTGRLFTIILRDIGQLKQSEEMLDQLQRENVYLQEELQNELNFEEIVGASPAIQKVFNSIEMVDGFAAGRDRYRERTDRACAAQQEPAKTERHGQGKLRRAPRKFGRK
jgi:hypothetical protein